MKRFVGAIALLTCIALAACGGIANDVQTEAEASDSRILDLDYVGTIDSDGGRPIADQYQDEDSCYWLYTSEGGLTQVFETYTYSLEGRTVKQSIPKCEE